jgi:putative glycosyltransferase (TIGR04372 family)
MTSIIRKIVGAAIRIVLLALFVFPVLPILIILEPVFRIRLSIVPTQRFGELSAQMDYFTRMMVDTKLYHRETHIMFGWDPCNEQLFKMFMRLPFINVIRSEWGTRVLFAWRPLLQKTRFWYRIKWDYAEFALFQRVRSPIEFTPEEHELGRAHLAEMGIGPDDWYVCFHARDDQYLTQWRPEVMKHWGERLAFKNTTIENYFSAIDQIVEKGGYAVRIGAAVSTELPERWGDKAIDYATHFRSDFMDIYLLAHARFFVCTSSGPLSVGTVFNVPLLITSHFPYSHTSNLKQDLILPRVVISLKTGDIVPFYEAQKDGFYVKSLGGTDIEEVDRYEMLESTANEILEGCKDLIASLEGRPVNPEALGLQTAYSENYLSHLPDAHLGGKIAPSWAIRHRDLFMSPHQPDLRSTSNTD